MYLIVEQKNYYLLIFEMKEQQLSILTLFFI